MEIATIEKEMRCIESFPEKEYIEIISEVGFECDFCGKCCTSEFNDHVFLLDQDAERVIEKLGKEFLRPAPYFDLCDNIGKFYVMGYALKTKQNGDCIFYSDGRCKHYELRPLICRIYPYMLHREPDDEGNIEFRQISGLNMHGLYNSDISEKECREILKSVKNYELGFLSQKLRFFRKCTEYFKKNHLSYSRHMYDKTMRECKKGKTIEVCVFYRNDFAKEAVQQIINLE